MNCYLFVALLAILVNIVYAYDAGKLTNKDYDDLLIADKNCNEIYFCSKYNPSSDCYQNCYASTVNKKINAICGSKDYVNPFKIQQKCGRVNGFNNYFDNKCYTTPYSTRVINTAGSRKTGGLKKIINGRCLSAPGWCSCTPGRVSSDRCGKMSNDVYV